MKNGLINTAKLALSAGLIVYLIQSVQGDDPATFQRLLDEPKRWGLLCAAWACFLLAVGTSAMRWRTLAGALQYPLSRVQAIRIGVLAYMLDFSAVGAAGGDLFRALSLGRRFPGRPAHALASVVADRVVGLGTNLVITSLVIVNMEAWRLPGLLPEITRGILIISATGIAGSIALLLVGGRVIERLATRIETLPGVGEHLANLLRAADLFRQRPGAVAKAAAISACTLALYMAGFHLITTGLSSSGPTLTEHTLIVPLAALSGLVPLPGDSLGVLDYAMSYLQHHATRGRTPAGLGLLVIMTFRVVSIAITLAGVAIWLWSKEPLLPRRESAEGGSRATPTFDKN